MAPKGPIDIHPTARPWSTQYNDDYNTRQAGQKRCKAHKQGKIWYRTPAATKIVPAPTVERAPQQQTRKYYVDVSDDEGDINAVKYSDTQNGGLPENVPLPVTEAVPAPEPMETEIIIPEPQEIPRDLRHEPHWICWPEPARPNTSLGIAPRAGHVNRQPDVTDSMYDPDFEYWINGKRDKLGRQTPNMYTLQRSNSVYEPTSKRMTSISVNDMPVRDTYTLYDGIRQQRNVDPTSLYRQNFFPYHQPGGAGVREDMVVQGLAKDMQGREPSTYNRMYSFNKYPLHMRKTRYRVQPATEDYVHEHSVFTTTTPRCVGHFIIHPDWVSERGGIRRSLTMIQPNRTAKTGGFRY